MLMLVSSRGAWLHAVLLLGCGLVRATRASLPFVGCAPSARAWAAGQRMLLHQLAHARLVQACSAPRLAWQVGKPPREATQETTRDDKNKVVEREAGVEHDEAVAADEALRY